MTRNGLHVTELGGFTTAIASNGQGPVLYSCGAVVCDAWRHNNRLAVQKRQKLCFPLFTPRFWRQRLAVSGQQQFRYSGGCGAAPVWQSVEVER